MTQNPWKQFLSNSTLLGITEMLNKGMPFLIILLVIRFLGVEQNGVLAASLALAGLFVLFADIGLSPLLIRDVSRNNDHASHYFSTVLSFKVVLSLCILPVGVLFVLFTKGAAITTVYTLGLMYVLIDNLNATLFQAGLRSIGRVDQEAIGKIIRGFGLLFGGIIGVFIFGSVTGVLIGYIGSAILQMIASIVFILRNNIALNLEFNITEWRRFIGLSKQFFINHIFYTVYYSIDTTMLSYMTTNEETGLYNAAYIFFAALYAIGSVLNMTIFPLFSKLFTSAREKWLQLYKKAAAFTLLASIASGAILFFLAPYMLPFVVVDGDIQRAIVGLQILSIGIMFAFQNTIFGALFNSSNNERLLLIPGIVGAVFNIVMNLVLIPQHGLYGAAITTVMTEAIVCGYFFILYRRKVLLPLRHQ